MMQYSYRQDIPGTKENTMQEHINQSGKAYERYMPLSVLYIKFSRKQHYSALTL